MKIILTNYNLNKKAVPFRSAKGKIVKNLEFLNFLGYVKDGQNMVCNLYEASPFIIHRIESVVKSLEHAVSREKIIQTDKLNTNLSYKRYGNWNVIFRDDKVQGVVKKNYFTNEIEQSYWIDEKAIGSYGQNANCWYIRPEISINDASSFIKSFKVPSLDNLRV